MRWTLAASAAAAVVLLGWWAFLAHPAKPAASVALDAGRPRPQGDYYVVAVGVEPEHLNPLRATDAVQLSAVLAYTHDALMETDPHTGEPGFTLAESAVAEEGGLAYVVTLRQGVRFSDGQPLTMADVLFTWELAGHGLPGTMWGDLRLLSRVEPIDDRRLRLVLRERTFAGLGLVGKAYTVVQKRWFVERVRALAERAGEPVPAGPADPAFARFLLEIDLPGPGTGPYELARASGSDEPLWRWDDADLLLLQNPHSWRKQAYPDQWNLAGMKLLFQRDPAAHRALLRRQAIDWLVVRDARELLAEDPELARHYDAYDYGYLTLGPVFVVWNHDHPALGERDVRRALTMLFDRDALVEHCGARARRANSWFAPDSPRAGDLEPLPHDVPAADALLRAAGFGPEGRQLDLEILTLAMPEYEEIVELAKPAFTRAGVGLRKQVVELSVLEERLAARAFDGLVYAWNPDVFNDPSEVFHSRAESNWMHYASADMDRVLEAARAELDPDARLALYHEFNRLFQRDQPVTLLYHRRISALLHQRFRGVEVGALGLNPRRWWVEPDDQLYR